jgi:hypothetical protein
MIYRLGHPLCTYSNSTGCRWYTRSTFQSRWEQGLVLEPEPELVLEPERELALEPELVLEPERELALEPEPELVLELERVLVLEPEQGLALEPERVLALEPGRAQQFHRCTASDSGTQLLGSLRHQLLHSQASSLAL